MESKLLFSKKMVVAGLLILGGSYSGLISAAEISCNQRYEVGSGDTLSGIASKAYDSSGKYTLIYYANKEQLPDGPSVIRVGQKLRIPCDDAESASAESEVSATQPSENDRTDADQETTTTTTTAATSTDSASSRSNLATARSIQLLTAGDYPPFTDQDLPQGGLITEILESALQTNNQAFRLNWINDWAAHLDPLLKEKKYDMGFPWFDPGCPEAKSFRCEFLFSKPAFELLIVLFTSAEKPIPFQKDEDIEGHTLCRPSGYFTHDLDNNGRNWLKDGKIKLEQPQAVKDCFDMLLEGKVDAVAINDFTGREAIARHGLKNKVVPVERELSVEGMHAVVHKSHPRATIMINRINRGLAALHESGKYDEIMDRHLLNHWKTVEALE